MTKSSAGIIQVGHAMARGFAGIVQAGSVSMAMGSAGIIKVGYVF